MHLTCTLVVLIIFLELCQSILCVCRSLALMCASVAQYSIIFLNGHKTFSPFLPALLCSPHACGCYNQPGLLSVSPLCLCDSLTTRSVALPSNCPNGLYTCWVEASNESFSLQAGRVSAPGRCWQAADVESWGWFVKGSTASQRRWRAMWDGGKLCWGTLSVIPHYCHNKVKVSSYIGVVS